MGSFTSHKKQISESAPKLWETGPTVFDLIQEDYNRKSNRQTTLHFIDPLECQCTTVESRLFKFPIDQTQTPKKRIAHLNLIISFLGRIFLRIFPEFLVRIITAKTLKKLPNNSDF